MISEEPMIVVAHRCQLTFDGTCLSIYRYGLSARLAGLARYEDIPARQVTSVDVYPPGLILGRGMLRLQRHCHHPTRRARARQPLRAWIASAAASRWGASTRSTRPRSFSSPPGSPASTTGFYRTTRESRRTSSALRT